MKTNVLSTSLKQDEIIHSKSEEIIINDASMDALEQETLARQSLVQIWGGNRGESFRFLGTGFFIARNIIATCRHVAYPRDGKDRPGKRPYAKLEIRLPFDGLSFTCINPSWNNPERDFTILEINTSLLSHVVPLPLLSGVMMHHEKVWLTPNWHFLGYSQNNLNGLPKHYKLTNRTNIGNELGIPIDVHLPQIGIAEGGSGSPILIRTHNGWVCTGIARLGREGAPISLMHTSSSFLQVISSVIRSKIQTIDVSVLLPSESFTASSLKVDEARQRQATVSRTGLLFRKPFARKSSFLPLLLTLVLVSALSARYYYQRKYNQSQCSTCRNPHIILVANYQPLSNQTLGGNLSKIIREKIYNYFTYQSKLITDIKTYQVIPIEDIIDVQSVTQANEIMARNHASAIFWGNYMISGNQISIQSYGKIAWLDRARATGNADFQSFEKIITSSIDTVLGRQPVALIHYHIGIIANLNKDFIEEGKHYRLYEEFDKEFTDRESMFQQTSPNNEQIMQIARVYRAARNPEADKLLELAHAACSPGDKTCKGYYYSEQGCALQANGESGAAEERFRLAGENFRASGDEFGVAGQLCNQAALLEKQNSLQDALKLWQECEKKLKALHNQNLGVRFVHGRSLVAIGRIHYRLCNVIEAQDYLEQIPKPNDTKDKTYSEALFYLALLDQKKSKPSDALIKVETALQFLPENAEEYLRTKMKRLQKELELQTGN